MRCAFHRTDPLCSTTRSDGAAASAGQNRASSGFTWPAATHWRSVFESTGGNVLCHRHTGLPSAPTSGPAGFPSAPARAQVNASYFPGSRTSSNAAGTRTFGVGLPNSTHFLPPSSYTIGCPLGRRHVSATGSCFAGTNTALSSSNTATPCSYSPTSPFRRE